MLEKKKKTTISLQTWPTKAGQVDESILHSFCYEWSWFFECLMCLVLNRENLL